MLCDYKFFLLFHQRLQVGCAAPDSQNNPSLLIRCLGPGAAALARPQRGQRVADEPFAPDTARKARQGLQRPRPPGERGKLHPHLFGLRKTNRETSQFHGYPVLPREAIGQLVFTRFSEWARTHGSPADRSASNSCRLRYDFR